MTSGKTVFELAIHLMDEGSPSTGEADTVDTKEYRNRTVPILNVLNVECYPYSDTYEKGEEGKRPVCPEVVDMDAPLPLDDGICRGVLPYGLAAHLLLGEDDEKAAYFNQRYEEKLAQMGRMLPAMEEEIPLAYGGIPFGQFGRW